MPKAYLDHETKELILARGKWFESALLPKDIKRGKPGTCFDTCMIRAMYSKGKYQYVEGFVIPPNGQPTLHAWLTDDGLNAYDPTWLALHNETHKEVAFPGNYCGIIMPMRKVMEYVSETTMQGILANRDLAPAKYRELFAGVLV